MLSCLQLRYLLSEMKFQCMMNFRGYSVKAEENRKTRTITRLDKLAPQFCWRAGRQRKYNTIRSTARGNRQAQKPSTWTRTRAQNRHKTIDEKDPKEAKTHLYNTHTSLGQYLKASSPEPPTVPHLSVVTIRNNDKNYPQKQFPFNNIFGRVERFFFL